MLSQPELGEQIRSARERAGLSINQLSKLARVSRTTASAIERGMQPSREAAERILQALAARLAEKERTPTDVGQVPA